MDYNMFCFIVLNIIAAATLCICLVIWIYNYKKRNELPSEQKIWQNSLAGGGIALVIFTYPIFYWITDIKEAIGLLLRVIPIIMGGIAFVIAFLNFKRKEGIDLTYIASFDADNYENQFFIVNHKDRTVILYDVMIKFKNISIQIPFKYPVILGNYSSECGVLGQVNYFDVYRDHGYLNVSNDEKKILDQAYEERVDYSGDIVLSELAKGEYEVYASTNIREKPFKLKKQNIGIVVQNEIHIDNIAILSEKTQYEKEAEEEYENTKGMLTLVSQHGKLKITKF